MGTALQAERDLIFADCRWFSDSGHAWLQVPLSAAREADQADKDKGGDGISACSYVTDSWAFLECDCDAAIFIDEFEADDSDRARFHSRGIVVDGPAAIRNLARWEA
jgi:hypothetical protein